MKRAFLFLSLCLALAGCDKPEGDWAQVELEYAEFEAQLESPGSGYYTIGITDGSGHYSVSIDDPSIADVAVGKNSFTGEPTVAITPKKLGETAITVTDKKSGSSARCALTVELYTPRPMKVDYIRTNVDADQPELIEADLLADAPLSAGGSILLQGGEWKFFDPNGAETAHGTFDMSQPAKWRDAYAFLPIDDQIQASVGFMLTCDDGREFGFDYYRIRGAFTRVHLFLGHQRFYEDLTEYYRSKYPDAGVRSVARVIIV
jgi:hypothetical protein